MNKICNLQKLKTFLQLLFSLLFIVFATISVKGQSKYRVQTIAFYNLENLFDTIRNVEIYDETFTPEGSYGWDTEKYQNKLENMSRVLSEIGTNGAMKLPPAIIGVCEIENKTVLEDLISMPRLAPYDYGIVHINSPDERGIDNGLLYRKDLFTVEHAVNIKTELPDSTDTTRDILVVSGNLDGENMHFIVNHWPSRSGGEAISRPNRAAAAHNLKSIIDSIQQIDKNAKIISMGDFNDDPVSPSIADILNAKGKTKKLKDITDLYNPYWSFYKKGYGTTAWRDAWSLFDMHIITNSLLEAENGYKFVKADRYTPDYIIQQGGRFKGYPKRTHAFGNYLNGYSDHFPVYLYLAKEIN